MANSQDPRHPTSLDDVFAALRAERLYQIRRWGYRQPDGSFKEAQHGVCEYLIYMQDYLTEAIHQAARQPGDSAALTALRKVVALGLACFEQWGIEPRQDAEPVINARDERTT